MYRLHSRLLVRNRCSKLDSAHNWKQEGLILHLRDPTGKEAGGEQTPQQDRPFLASSQARAAGSLSQSPLYPPLTHFSNLFLSGPSSHHVFSTAYSHVTSTETKEKVRGRSNARDGRHWRVFSLSLEMPFVDRILPCSANMQFAEEKAALNGGGAGGGRRDVRKTETQPIPTLAIPSDSCP